MKIALIKPNIGRMEHSLYVDEGRMEPLQLGVIAGFTPPEVDVVLFDDRMEDIQYDEPVDLAAITVETYTARRSYEIAAEYRRRGVPVILGGFHPTLIPEEASKYADAIFIGDAESIWDEVLNDVRSGTLKPIYSSPPGIPQPGSRTRRDMFRGKGYLPISLIQFGRGCEFECSYCAISVYFNKTQFRRNIRELVEEIESLDNRILFFVDDNIISNSPAAKELFRELIPLKIQWVSQASVDMTDDLELMDLMAKSGCLGHVIGFETLDPANLRSSKKSPNISAGFDAYETRVKVMKDYGLQIWGAFTLGYDNDTPSSIDDMAGFAEKHKFSFAAFNILMPYPNTPFYKELEAEGRLLYDKKWWLHPEYRFNHAAFVPKSMSADELTEAGFRARKRFNRPISILKRAFDLRTNMKSLFRLGIYTVYTPLFRKETFKKQGMRFGYK